MADNVTNELLLETLKAIQSKLADIASDIVDLKADMRGMKGHMAAFMQKRSRTGRLDRFHPVEN